LPSPENFCCFLKMQIACKKQDPKPANQANLPGMPMTSPHLYILCTRSEKYIFTSRRLDGTEAPTVCQLEMRSRALITSSRSVGARPSCALEQNKLQSARMAPQHCRAGTGNLPVLRRYGRLFQYIKQLKLLRSMDLFRRHLKAFLFHSVYGHQDTD